MWSKIRDTIVGDGKPRVSGHIAYRGVLKREEVPKDLWRPDVVLWAGPRTHRFVHYPLRRGELYNPWSRCSTRITTKKAGTPKAPKMMIFGSTSKNAGSSSHAHARINRHLAHVDVV